MASITLRRWIQRHPAEAEEPTSTIVLTSPKQHFVDLRILRQQAIEKPLERAHEEVAASALTGLDWAFAGQSILSTKVNDKGENVPHIKWNHWVDSTSTEPESVADEADMILQPDGTTLEQGTDIDEVTGAAKYYEELWENIKPVSPTGGVVKVVVLRYQGNKSDESGMAILLGHYCHGLSRRGQSISAERWKWSNERGWNKLFSIGDDALPCKTLLESADGLVEGSNIDLNGEQWGIIEVV